MSFKTIVDKGGEYAEHTYYDTIVMPSGQTIKIEFEEDWTGKKYYYNIYLVTMDKRKSENNTYLRSMGKDGINGLIWARGKIQEFEEFIKEKHTGIPVVIVCRWADNRRRNVYEYGLKRLGYNFQMVYGSKALCKTVVG